MSRVTPYRLTLLTAILCLCILGAVSAVILLAIGTSPSSVAALFGFLAPTIAALVAVYRSEANAQNVNALGAQQLILHVQNQSAIEAVNAKVDGLQSAAAAAGAAAALSAQSTLSEGGSGGAH